MKKCLALSLLAALPQAACVAKPAPRKAPRRVCPGGSGGPPRGSRPCCVTNMNEFLKIDAWR